MCNNEVVDRERYGGVAAEVDDFESMFARGHLVRSEHRVAPNRIVDARAPETGGPR